MAQAAAGSSSGDMFLSVKGAKSGPIKGESQDTVHADEISPIVTENVVFSFNKITVEYVPQGKDGQAKGSTQFTDQWDQSS